MAGRLVVLAAIAAAAVVAGSALAAPKAALDPSKLTLAAADFPGSHAKGAKGPSVSGPIVDQYSREIMLAQPYGASRYRVLLCFVFVAKDDKTGAVLYHQLGRSLSSKRERLSFVKDFLGTGAAASSTTSTQIKPRGLGVHDSSMEVGFVFKQAAQRFNVEIDAVRVDRVIDMTIAVGTGTSVAVADGTAIAKLEAGHIASQLAPALTTAPAITGTAAQGQTLTANLGLWDGADAFTVEWQRCDPAGTCTAIDGATGATYAVAPGDVGYTLRVVVTGANRFGSLPATSPATAAVT